MSMHAILIQNLIADIQGILLSVGVKSFYVMMLAGKNNNRSFGDFIN